MEQAHTAATLLPSRSRLRFCRPLNILKDGSHNWTLRLPNEGRRKGWGRACGDNRARNWILAVGATRAWRMGECLRAGCVTKQDRMPRMGTQQTGLWK